MEDTPTFSTLSGDDDRRLGGVKPRAQLYIVLDCDRPCAAPSRHGLEDVDVVLIGRGPERHVVRVREEGRRILRLTIPDRRTSREHARLVRTPAGWTLEDLESKNGSVLNRLRVSGARRLTSGDLIELGHTFFFFQEHVPTAAHDPADLVAPLTGATSDDGLGTLNPPLAYQLAELRRLALVDTTVAVLGETGTGKELIARAVHTLSGRPGAFVAVNCGAIPESLLESELFGYKKGAFSGALGDQVGLVQASNAGTLFLDEVGDLPAPSQAALLRVIQEKEVRPLGGRQPERVDLRVVCATHRDLPGMVARGQFRADLWARLSGVVVRLPPLRARREDFGLLFGALLRKLAPERVEDLSLTRDSARAMLSYHWPLNVRELENLLRTGLGLMVGNVLDIRPVETVSVPPDERLGAPGAAAPASTPGDDEREDDDDDEVDTPGESPAGLVPEVEGDLDTRRQTQIIALLKQFDGNVIAVAKAMRRSRGAIHRWIKKYGIDADRYRK